MTRSTSLTREIKLSLHESMYVELQGEAEMRGMSIPALVRYKLRQMAATEMTAGEQQLSRQIAERSRKDDAIWKLVAAQELTDERLAEIQGTGASDDDDFDEDEETDAA